MLSSFVRSKEGSCLIVQINNICTTIIGDHLFFKKTEHNLNSTKDQGLKFKSLATM
jgi:hypothetical protein